MCFKLFNFTYLIYLAQLGVELLFEAVLVLEDLRSELVLLLHDLHVVVD